MKIKNALTRAFGIMIAFAFAAGLSSAAFATDDKLSTEDIIKKHLESIGTADARKELKTISVTGKAQAVSRGRAAGETTGIVVIASDGKKNLLGMNFNNNDYPGERMGFDGEEFTVGFQSPGERSKLGAFMLANSKTFEIGIFGGVLSTGWELLSYDESVGRLKCGGTSKIDGVKHHKCSYNPKKGSDLDITMYFHPETFRHVRTEYKRIISGGQGLGVDNSVRQNEKRYRLTEDFSDFQDIGGITMPHQYLVTLDMNEGNSSTNIEWRMDLANFRMNEPIDPASFKMDN